jgi:hypothetical protein
MTMLKRIVLPAVLSLAALSPALANVDLVPWGESGAWKILKDPNRGNGCLVETGYGDGTYLRIGFDKKGDGTGYVSSFNPAWTEIKDDKKYDVTVTFGDQSFVGEGRGGKLGDMHGIIVKSNNLDLLVALAEAESVNLAVAGGPGLDLGLEGSKDALTQALVCQAE